MKRNRLQLLILSSIFTAIIGILAQITIPFPLVPITGQTLAIGLAATILGARYGTISTLLYIAVGAIGVPIFASMQGGIGAIVGPTGGYLIGFIPTAYFIGWYIEKTKLTFTHVMIANLIGMIITLAFGTIWLKISASLSWSVAISTGVLPFLIGGILKAALTSYIGVLVKKRLYSARLLPKEMINS